MEVAYYDSYDKELLFCMGVWYLQPTYYLNSFINALTMDTTMDASIRNPNPIFYMIDTTGGFCWILVEKWLMVSKNNSK